MGPVELDLGRYELRCSGRRVRLEKKPMELLIFLVGRRDQLVSREDIVNKLWRSNLFIDTERNLNNVVRKIRTALGDNPGKAYFIETVVGKGYRFIGPIRVIDAQYRRDDRELSGHRVVMASQSHWRQCASLLVLPLVVVGRATDDQGRCLGFADALVALLGNLRNVDVLPIATVLGLPAEVPPSEIAHRMGIRFVVHGAMQMSKGQWQLSLALFDAHAQEPRWSRKCQLDTDRLFELESHIATRRASHRTGRLHPAMVGRHQGHSRDPLAYEEFMGGYQLSAAGDPAATEKAIPHLSDAVTRDPAFALAHATLSYACATRH